MNKGIIFDRDGTLIKFVNYISNPDDVELIYGVRELILKLKKNNYKIFLHTNQSGISRGYFTDKDLENVQSKFLNMIGIKNAFDEIAVSTSLPNSNCKYRKPTDHFAKKISEKYKIDINELIYVGDTDSDLMCAVHADCFGIGVNYGKSDFKKKYKSYKKITFVNDVISLENEIFKIFDN